MKVRNIIKIWAVVLPLTITLGCNDDFTSITPLSEVSESSVWTDAGLAEATVTGAYNGLGAGGLDEQMLASLTDEAIFNDTSMTIKNAIQNTFDNNSSKTNISKTAFEVALKQLV